MEINTVTYFGWRNNYQTVEKRTIYDYPKGNDVIVVEHRNYLVTLYEANGTTNKVMSKGDNIDQLA